MLSGVGATNRPHRAIPASSEPEEGGGSLSMNFTRESLILRGTKSNSSVNPSTSSGPASNHAHGSRGAEAAAIPEVADVDESLEPPGKFEDHFGFLHSVSEKGQMHTLESGITGRKARQREVKWLRMLENWDDWIGKKKPKLKERCRKGIPSSIRGKAWLFLSGANDLMRCNVGQFDELVRKPDNEVVLNVIDKDLDRTFPSHVLFAKEGSQGQRDLRRVLKAYAMYNQKTGYCQAMAPVAATLLMHMTDEEAFWCLVQICEQYLPGYYSPGLHAFQIDALILKDLLQKYLPDIKRFMDSKLPPGPADSNRGLDPMLYCTEWLMSIFSRSLPWPTVLRVWDMFFFEGVKALFKVALAILSLAFGAPQNRKDCPGFFELTRKLRDIPTHLTHEEVLIPEALKFKIRMHELRQEHIAQADRHFSEERVRIMELQARRLRSRSTFSVTSDMSET